VWDPEKIKQLSEQDFEKTWTESSKLLLETGPKITLGKNNTPHPLEELRQKVRAAFIKHGFEEAINKTIIDVSHVYHQYGPEAPVILDRVYYLAGLERPDIGLSPEKKEKISSIIPGFSGYDVLQEILRAYREGKIEGDDFLEELVKKLGIEEEQASALVSDVFREFSELKPVPSTQTLRSHMTAGWFLTLQEVLKKRFTPVALFSIGYRFRREQKEDAHHLRAHLGASAVIAHENMSLSAGREITQKVLEEIGFSEVEFVRKKATSKYYAKGMEEEVFARYGKKKIEIADIGMYSPIALSNYGINIPVFNFGMGMERIAMIQHGYKDVRQLVYKQALAPFVLSDHEIAEHVYIDKKPSAPEGKLIASSVSNAILEYGNSQAPARYKVYDRDLGKHHVTVWVFEKEEGKSLCGPAALNEVIVYDGNVMALPPSAGAFQNDLVKNALEKGVKTGISFRDAIGAFVASEAEAMTEFHKIIQFKNVKSGQDINISVHPLVQRYVTAHKKRLSLKGPVFVSVEIQKERI